MNSTFGITSKMEEFLFISCIVTKLFVCILYWLTYKTREVFFAYLTVHPWTVPWGRWLQYILVPEYNSWRSSIQFQTSVRRNHHAWHFWCKRNWWWWHQRCPIDHPFPLISSELWRKRFHFFVWVARAALHPRHDCLEFAFLSPSSETLWGIFGGCPTLRFESLRLLSAFELLFLNDRAELDHYC